MSDQVKFVGVHREKEKNGKGGVIHMSDQVNFVGVHRERRTGEGWPGYTYVGSSKIRGST